MVSIINNLKTFITMAAEDPRFLLHFKTLAKFNEKLADGTVSADKHLVFIKDAKQVWFKGTYYADNIKMDGITDFYNGWSITQSSATTLTITLTGKRWNASTRAWKAISKPLSVNSATQSIAGLMSAADKVKLDGLNINNVSNISFSSDAAKVTATISKDNGNAADTSTTVNLPVASSTSAGSMSATDKIELDRISTANFALGAVTPAASTVGIAASKTTISTGASATNNITLPAATQSVAGVMTAADKVKLDVTLPNLINNNKTNIDKYTVNGFKISTNPVLDGADIKITGYTKPSTTGALAAADSVNGALGKLEKKLDDEVTNRTNAVSNLTNTVNSNKSTIDNYTINGAKISTNPKITVTVGGSGNAVTAASFSGTVLTLTKGATYNNYSHPAGSGASKSTGLYKFSTDSTSHISGVTAVTKSDITALGIPSSDTNTTYTFASGTGNFTVTPSGGSKQTVSIGKPSTAGTADKVANTLTFTGYQSKSYDGSAAVSVAIPSKVSDLTNDSGYITSYTDTKNTTGSTNSSSKLYLVGATSQASNPVTYSNSGVYTQSGAVYASAGFYDTSDMRVKDNIESIDVSKADKIRLVEFDRTDREHHGYGVIAQELETVYPSMVNTDENGFKTVNYSEIYAVKIKYLEDKIAALEAIVDKLINK
ncbi:MAG: chaperone of endosialidase [Bacteriophage sp.]|nr:MAG: chaperone of endosialidase [Bacteriophage sp.]